MYRSFAIIATSTVLCSALTLSAPASIAAISLKDEPATFAADTLNYNADTEIISADGHVEIMHSGRIIHADHIEYHKGRDALTASGDIRIYEPDGSVFFGDELELKEGFSKGEVKNFKARLSDGSLLAAAVAERKSLTKIVLHYAAYSPCSVGTCLEETQACQSPEWQINAKKVIYDHNKEQLVYQKAFFEVFGYPVPIIVPFFAHSSPNAGRKTGFLMPRYTKSSTFGTEVRLPFYYTIQSNMDVTLTPVLFTKENGLLLGEFRHLTQKGHYHISGSGTHVQKFDSDGTRIEGNEYRGHIQGQGNFQLERGWYTGFKAKIASDKTYLKRYSFSDEDYLFNQLFLEHYHGRRYGGVELIGFQSLSQDSTTAVKTPYVLPRIFIHTEPHVMEVGKLSVDISSHSIYQHNGPNTQRLTIENDWHIPHVTQSGHVLGVHALARADTYYIENQPIANDRSFDGFKARLIPELQFDWSLPLIRHSGKSYYMVEPVVNLILGPTGINSSKIPNEDSQEFEFSDENLFASNRFTGFDFIEEGARINYGVRGGIYVENGSQLNYLFGQAYHREDGSFSSRTGLQDHFSDYVGWVRYQPASFIDLNYSFRMDKDDYRLHRNEFGGTVSYYPIDLSVDYISLTKEATLTNKSRQEVLVKTKLNLSQHVELHASARRNLEDSRMIKQEASLVYNSGCTTVIVGISKDFTESKDIKPDAKFSFRLSLKNIN